MFVLEQKTRNKTGPRREEAAKKKPAPHPPLAGPARPRTRGRPRPFFNLRVNLRVFIFFVLTRLERVRCVAARRLESTVLPTHWTSANKNVRCSHLFSLNLISLERRLRLSSFLLRASVAADVGRLGNDFPIHGLE